MERFAQALAGVAVAVHDANGAGAAAHAGDKAHQTALVGVGGIAADGVHAGADGQAFAVQGQVAALPRLLQGAAGGAGALVADEQYIVAGVAEQGFQVIDDAAAGAHAAAGDDDGRSGAVAQVGHHAFVGGVVVDGDELVEAQGAVAFGDALQGFLRPVGFEVAVGLGEAAGQRRIEYYGYIPQGVLST